MLLFNEKLICEESTTQVDLTICSPITLSLFGCYFGNRFYVSKTAKRVWTLLPCVWQSVLNHETIENKNSETQKMKTNPTCFQKVL
jgi:hypothetical protein